MTQNLRLKCCAQLVVVALTAYAVKLYYSTASVNQLRWILAPAAFAVELITGMRFDFESHSGYINSEHTFVIAAPCAGVNFLIASFLMLAIRKLWIDRAQGVSWKLFPVVAVCAYAATIVANTLRIAVALQLHDAPVGGMSPQQLHRFEGIVVYFGCLLMMYIAVEKMSARQESSHVDAVSVFRRVSLPLFVYYAIAFAVPFVNGGYRRSAEFWEHSLFVFATPLVLIAPFMLFAGLRSLAAKRSQYHPR